MLFRSFFLRSSHLCCLSCDSFVSFRAFLWPAKLRLGVLLFLATKRHKRHKNEQTQRLPRFSATKIRFQPPLFFLRSSHLCCLSCDSFVSFRCVVVASKTAIVRAVVSSHKETQDAQKEQTQRLRRFSLDSHTQSVEPISVRCSQLAARATSATQ